MSKWQHCEVGYGVWLHWKEGEWSEDNEAPYLWSPHHESTIPAPAIPKLIEQLELLDEDREFIPDEIVIKQLAELYYTCSVWWQWAEGYKIIFLLDDGGETLSQTVFKFPRDEELKALIRLLKQTYANYRPEGETNE